MSGTVVQYGSITINGAHTVEFDEAAVYDDSNTDIIGHKIMHRIRGHIFLADAGGDYSIHGITGGGAPQDGAAASFKAIRFKMLTPRLVYNAKLENDTLLYVFPLDDSGDKVTFDRNNGPKPIDFRIIRFVGNKAMEVEFAIELFISACETGANNVMSNRWSVTDSRDENFFITRKYSGKLRTDGSQSPHNFHSFILPTLASGFQRLNIEATSTPDNLNLEYNIIDRSVCSVAPAPATSWSTRHFISTTKAMFNVVTVAVRLEAPPGVSKTDLLTTLCAVLSDRARFHGLGGAAGGSANIGTIDDNKVNAVEGMIQFQSINVIGNVGNVQSWRAALESSGLGQPLGITGYDPKKALEPVDFADSGPSGILACYLQTPCPGTKHSITDAKPPEKTTTTPTTATSSIPVAQQVTLETLKQQIAGSTTQVDLFRGSFSAAAGASAGDPFSQDHLTNMYTYYELESTYPVSTNKLQLPTGASANSSEATSVCIAYARPTARRIIKVAAERVGDWPDVPNTPDFNDSNGVKYQLLWVSAILPAPEYLIDGEQKLYSVTATYVYAMSRALTSQEKLDPGSLAWDNLTPANTLVGGDQIFTSGIV